MCISAICRPAKNISAPFYPPRANHTVPFDCPHPFQRLSSPATSMLAIHHLQPPLPAPLIGGRARRATSKREEASSLERTAQNTLSRCHGRSRRCRHRIRRSPLSTCILLVIAGTLPYSRTTADQPSDSIGDSRSNLSLDVSFSFLIPLDRGLREKTFKSRRSIARRLSLGDNLFEINDNWW